MANISKGRSFGATETLTAAKLHELVDNATVTSIVNTDIDANAAIADTKLAQISTISKVTGKAITALASLPAGAGLIPYANIPATTLVSIPNASLLPLTLASWVSGQSFRNLASIPSGAGYLPQANLVPSLASGGLVLYDGSVSFSGKNFSELDKTFGSWTTGTRGSSTAAPSDGFLVLYLASADLQSLGAKKIAIKTDSSNPPTTTRDLTVLDGLDLNLRFLRAPVKQNDYYLCEEYNSGSLNNGTVYFLPFHE